MDDTAEHSFEPKYSNTRDLNKPFIGRFGVASNADSIGRNILKTLRSIV